MNIIIVLSTTFVFSYVVYFIVINRSRRRSAFQETENILKKCETDIEAAQNFVQGQMLRSIRELRTYISYEGVSSLINEINQFPSPDILLQELRGFREASAQGRWKFKQFQASLKSFSERCANSASLKQRVENKISELRLEVSPGISVQSNVREI